MNTNSKGSNQNEEVDLSTLFKLIGAAIDRFFNFFNRIFKNAFLTFVWLIFLIKKHVIVLFLALFLGYSIGFFIAKSSTPKFNSSIEIVQNYPTGHNLYSLVKYYNNLIEQKDFEALGKALELDAQIASKMLYFDINPVVSGNKNLIIFNEFLLEIDTLASPKVEYDEFVENIEDPSYKHQRISIKSTLKNSFEPVFSKILNSISSNPYFISEQKKDITELIRIQEALESSLVKSDSLKDTYKRVLEQELINNNSSEIGITFEGSSNTKVTREYELYLSDLEIERELVETKRALLDKQYIVEIIPNKQDAGVTSDSKEILGFELPLSQFLALSLFLLTFSLLLVLEFLRFIERFRPQITKT
tara:strand:+ start:42 stop:1124 length:1083 start_codon:yes stop_codon:yes gene_type:complete